jgi:hypothetical protein
MCRAGSIRLLVIYRETSMSDPFSTHHRHHLRQQEAIVSEVLVQVLLFLVTMVFALGHCSLIRCSLSLLVELVG